MRNFPLRPERQKMINAPAAVIALIAVLLAIHLVRVLVSEDWSIWSLYMFAFIPARLAPGAGFPMVPGSQWWSFLSHAFLHGNWMHVIVNCLWLLIFGTPVARLLGTLRFLAIAAASAIGGAAVWLAFHWGEQTLLVGASGAVSGLMAASVPIIYGTHSPGHRLSFRALISDRSALIFMGIWLVITLISGSAGLTGSAFEAPIIAWEAHLGGFVVGLAALYALDRAPRHGTT